MRLIGLALGFALIAPSALADPKSELQSAPEFAACKWTTVVAGAVSLSGFDCSKAPGATRIVGDARLPGFWLETKEADGTTRRLALRTFSKPAKADLGFVLPQVRKASPGPATATCRLEAYSAKPYTGARAYVLAPTGDAKKAFDAGETNEPCGPLGVAQVGDRYFYVAKGRPQTVVLVDLGSEIQPFDPATLKFGAPAK